MSSSPQVALVTGAGRGLGRAIAARLAGEGIVTYAATRSPAPEQKGIRPLMLDVTSDASVQAAVAQVLGVEGHLDIVVNNAGRGYDLGQVPSSVRAATAGAVLDTNLLGPWRVSNAVIPAMVARGHGRIVNISSEAGSFALTEAAAPAYAVSKVALNMLTMLLAREVAGTGVLVNACCPGWVRTDMGGPGGDLSPDEGADTPCWLATLPYDGPTGGFYARRQRVDW